MRAPWGEHSGMRWERARPRGSGDIKWVDPTGVVLLLLLEYAAQEVGPLGVCGACDQRLEGRIIRRSVVARWRRDDACAALTLAKEDE